MTGSMVFAFIIVAIGLFWYESRRHPGWLVQEFPKIYNPRCFDCNRDNDACSTCPYRRML